MPVNESNVCPFERLSSHLPVVAASALARLRANNLEPAGQCQAYAAKQGAALDKRLADEKAKGG